MSTRLSGRNPLAYLGVEALTPPNMITSPVSPTAESRNANVGDYWLNTTNSNLYILASLSDMIATWVLIHSTVSSIDFVTNSGTAIPAANIINLFGGTGITTSASGNTIDVILSTPVSIANGGTNATSMTNSNGVVYFNGTSLVTTTVGTAGQILTSQGVGMPPHFAANTASSTFNADSGSATPSAGVITLHGTGDITTSATGSTVTFAGAGVTTVNTGSGSATASSNAITIAGGTGIATTGSGSTVTIAATGALTQTFAADSGTATPSAGTITMAGGSNISTSAAGSTVTYNVSGATNHAVQVGNAGGSLTSLTVGTNGQVLLGSTAANPSFVTPTAGTGLSITTNASTLQYALSTPVSVPNGGTGATSFTAHSILLGEGTSAISALGAATNGQLPIGSTGADPVLATITAGTNVTVTNGAGSITIAANTGAASFNYTAVNHAASPYTVLSTDYYIGADVTAGVISILLPNAPSTGRAFVVKDKAGLAATSNITVTTVGGAVNIDGATSFVMNTAYEAISLIWNGSSYEIY